MTLIKKTLYILILSVVFLPSIAFAQLSSKGSFTSQVESENTFSWISTDGSASEIYQSLWIQPDDAPNGYIFINAGSNNCNTSECNIEVFGSGLINCDNIAGCYGSRPTRSKIVLSLNDCDPSDPECDYREYELFANQNDDLRFNWFYNLLLARLSNLIDDVIQFFDTNLFSIVFISVGLGIILWIVRKIKQVLS